MFSDYGICYTGLLDLVLLSKYFNQGAIHVKKFPDFYRNCAALHVMCISGVLWLITHFLSEVRNSDSVRS